MVLFHLTWFVVLLWNILFEEVEITPLNFYLGAILFISGQTLRLWAIKTLGNRWCTQILITPNFRATSKGPFKYLKHPNYLGVILEIFALPLMISLIREGAILSIINLVIILFRIRLEESYLSKYSQYDEVFKNI